MDKEEIEKRIIVCDERARGYLEVGKCGLADKYYTEKHKWEKLLGDLDLLNDRKIYELLEYKRSYFTLVKKCEKKQEVIKKAIDKLQLLIDIGFDYDGFNQADSLKTLIDELVGYARESRNILMEIEK